MERDPSAVQEDVEEGYITVERARDCYGVAISETDGEYTIDMDQTEELRTDGTTCKNQ
jgi:N-methylhydantoinase B